MKILMIEDQRHFADMVVHSLEGLDIDVAYSMGAALARLDDERFDLLLVDLSLPDSEGVGTLRTLQPYKIPMVVLTGRFDISGDIAQMAGVQDYIVKYDGGPLGVYERILFNIRRLEAKRRPRFCPEVFEELKECFRRSRTPFEVGELTTA